MDVLEVLDDYFHCVPAVVQLSQCCMHMKAARQRRSDVDTDQLARRCRAAAEPSRRQLTMRQSANCPTVWCFAVAIVSDDGDILVLYLKR